jgi:hypothetical protein
VNPLKKVMNLFKQVLFGAAYKDERARIIHRIAIALVVLTGGFSVAMGLLGFEFFSGKGFLEPLYVSWVSGAALFLLSIWIAITQLDNPAAQDSRRRMEILVQGREGPAVEYFLRKFHEFEHYAEFSQQKIVVKSYSADGSRVQVEKSASMLLKNFIEDVWSSFTHTVAHDTAVDDDDLRILYFRVGGKLRPIDSFNEGKLRSATYDVRVEPRQGVLVEFALRHWIKNPQNVVQSVPRFTSRLTLHVENHTDRVVVFTRGEERVELPPGDVQPILEVHNLPPGLAYSGELTVQV